MPTEPKRKRQVEQRRGRAVLVDSEETELGREDVRKRIRSVTARIANLERQLSESQAELAEYEAAFEQVQELPPEEGK